MQNFTRNVLFLSPPIPTHVDIEICTSCNLNCKMCKRETIDFGNQLMPYDRYTAILERLPQEVKCISFGGYGEMLIHPRFYEMVADAKKRGFFTQTTSNGTLLVNDRRMEALLNSGLDEYRISIDHVRPTVGGDVGHVFSKNLLEIVKRLEQKRKAAKSPIRLGINTVVHRENFDEIIEIVQFADVAGVDFIELIRLDTCANNATRQLSESEENALYKRIEKMPKRIEVLSPINRFAGLRRLYNLRQQYCPFRLKGAHVRMNGAVTPCAFGFAAHDFGNILEKSLEEIWLSAPFKAIRKNDKNPTCQSCSIF